MRTTGPLLTRAHPAPQKNVRLAVFRRSRLIPIAFGMKPEYHEPCGRVRLQRGESPRKSQDLERLRNIRLTTWARERGAAPASRLTARLRAARAHRAAGDRALTSARSARRSTASTSGPTSDRSSDSTGG